MAVSVRDPGLPPEDPSTVSQDKTLPELLSELTDELTTLFRQEVELAKTELKQQASRAGKASGMLVAGGVIGFVAFLLVSWAIAFLIALVLPTWLGFAIVGVVYAVIAAVVASVGRKQLKQVNPKPEQTVASLKEDQAWLKNRT